MRQGGSQLCLRPAGQGPTGACPARARGPRAQFSRITARLLRAARPGALASWARSDSFVRQRVCGMGHVGGIDGFFVAF